MKLNKNFFLLLQGQCVSNIGNMIYRISYMWWIQSVTGSTLKTSLAILLSMIPNVFLAPIISDYMKNKNLKKIIIFSDIFSGIINIIVSCLVLSGYFSINILYILILFMGISSCFFKPAVFAILPAIVDDSLLVKANSISTTCMSIFSIIGTAIGSALIINYGIGVAFLINGATFLLSAMSETLIRYTKAKFFINKKPSFISGFLLLKSSLFQYPISKYVLLYGGINFFLAIIIVYLPFLANDVVLYGQMKNAETIATIIVGMVLGKIGSDKFIRHKNFVYYSTLAIIIGYLLIGISSNRYILILAEMILGAGVLITGVTINSSLQIYTSKDDMIKVATLKNAINDLFMTTGTLFAGFLGVFYYPNLIILVLSGLFLIFISILYRNDKVRISDDI